MIRKTWTGIKRAGNWFRAPFVRRRKRIELSKQLAALKEKRERKRQGLSSRYQTITTAAYSVKPTPEQQIELKRLVVELEAEGKRELGALDEQIRGVEMQLEELGRKPKKK
jgi:hypothetical protein